MKDGIKYIKICRADNKMDTQKIETEIKRLEKAIETGEVCNSAEFASVSREIARLKTLLNNK